MAVRVSGNVADDVSHVLQIDEVEACGRAVRQPQHAVRGLADQPEERLLVHRRLDDRPAQSRSP